MTNGHTDTALLATLRSVLGIGPHDDVVAESRAVMGRFRILDSDRVALWGEATALKHQIAQVVAVLEPRIGESLEEAAERVVAGRDDAVAALNQIRQVLPPDEGVSLVARVQRAVIAPCAPPALVTALATYDAALRAADALCEALATGADEDIVADVEALADDAAHQIYLRQVRPALEAAQVADGPRVPRREG